MEVLQEHHPTNNNETNQSSYPRGNSGINNNYRSHVTTTTKQAKKIQKLEITTTTSMIVNNKQGNNNSTIPNNSGLSNKKTPKAQALGAAQESGAVAAVSSNESAASLVDDQRTVWTSGIKDYETSKQRDDIIQLNNNDVVCWESGHNVGYDIIYGQLPGNLQFQNMVKKEACSFFSSSACAQVDTATRIVRQVHVMDPPGRFLTTDTNGHWHTIGNAHAIKYTLRALWEEAKALKPDGQEGGARTAGHHHAGNEDDEDWDGDASGDSASAKEGEEGWISSSGPHSLSSSLSTSSSSCSDAPQAVGNTCNNDTTINNIRTTTNACNSSRGGEAGDHSSNLPDVQTTTRKDVEGAEEETNDCSKKKKKRKFVPWEDRFQELQRYKDEHNGNANPRRHHRSEASSGDVPSREDSLAKWLGYQRKKYRDGTLSQNKVQYLHELGCEGFGGENVSAELTRQRKKQWGESYQELQEYKKEHGHANPEGAYHRLGRWLWYQRSYFRRGILTIDKIQKLRDIGCHGFEAIAGTGAKTGTVDNNAPQAVAYIPIAPRITKHQQPHQQQQQQQAIVMAGAAGGYVPSAPRIEAKEKVGQALWDAHLGALGEAQTTSKSAPAGTGTSIDCTTATETNTEPMEPPKASQKLVTAASSKENHQQLAVIANKRKKPEAGHSTALIGPGNGGTRAGTGAANNLMPQEAAANAPSSADDSPAATTDNGVPQQGDSDGDDDDDDGIVRVMAVANKRTSTSRLGLLLTDHPKGAGGVIISCIDPTSVFAASDLQVGMKILSINDVDFQSLKVKEAVNLLKGYAGSVTICAATTDDDTSSNSPPTVTGTTVAAAAPAPTITPPTTTKEVEVEEEETYSSAAKEGEEVGIPAGPHSQSSSSCGDAVEVANGTCNTTTATATNTNTTTTNNNNNTQSNAYSSGGSGGEEAVDQSLVLPGVGSRIAVYWSDDEEYYEGEVTKTRKKKKTGQLGKSRGSNNKSNKNLMLEYQIEYDDGDTEWLDLTKHKFKIPPPPSAAAASSSGGGDYSKEKKNKTKQNASARPYVPWEEHYQELQAYKKKYGHANPPLIREGNRAHFQLGMWLTGQQSAFRKGTINEEKAKKLRKLGCLGFDNKPKKNMKRTPQDQREQKQIYMRWDDRIQELQKYKDEHNGDANPRINMSEKSAGGVPSIENSLAQWLQDQRKKYRKGALSQKKIDELHEMGCDGFGGENATGKLTRSRPHWDECCLELQEYKKKFGHANPKRSKGPYYKLGRWVSDQRQSFRDGKLTNPTLIQKLKDVGCQGFEENDEGERQQNWDDNINKLRAYKEREGHANPRRVAGISEDDLKLARWLYYQQRQFRKGQLTQRKLAELRKLGCDGFEASQEGTGTS